ncbi:MAG: DUF4082 domain-containing protein [Verrucomicrobia bacterium]|nr:DUF4082 domain-containing protein [Verrucomicrobiota bacterium]
MKFPFLALGALVALHPSLSGSQTAVVWDGSQADHFSHDDGAFTLGFQFRATSDLTVTALGAYDYLGDGFATSHTVGIWRADGGDPIATTTLSAGTTASLRGQFRFGDIPGVTLSAGTEYVIGASEFFGATKDIYTGGIPVSAFSVDPNLTFLGARGSGEADGLNFPGVHFDPGSPTTFGANFEFVVVPEPSVAALLAVGGLAGAVALRRRSGSGGGAVVRKDSTLPRRSW